MIEVLIAMKFLRNLRNKKKYRLIAGVLLTGAVLAAALYNWLTVTQYTLQTDKLSQPVRIALLTDLHSCFFGENQKDLIAAIHAQQPDLILMAGDIADDELPHDGTIELLKGIAGQYPAFYVSGNHEVWSGEIETIKMLFRAYGVAVLEGACQTVEIAGQSLNICGVDDPDAGDEEDFDRQLESAFDAIDDSSYTILLSHRPERFAQAAAYPACDLVLSGHAHGGQWRIPYLLDGLIAPNQGFFPKYTSGVHTINETQMLVSRGLARNSTAWIPRICNPPELVIIDLTPQFG